MILIFPTLSHNGLGYGPLVTTVREPRSFLRQDWRSSSYPKGNVSGKDPFGQNGGRRHQGGALTIVILVHCKSDHGFGLPDSAW